MMANIKYQVGCCLSVLFGEIEVNGAEDLSQLSLTFLKGGGQNTLNGEPYKGGYSIFSIK